MKRAYKAIGQSSGLLSIPSAGRQPMKHLDSWFQGASWPELSIPSAGRQPMKPAGITSATHKIGLSIPSAGRQPMKRRAKSMDIDEGASFNTLCGSSANEASRRLYNRLLLSCLSIPSAGRQPMKPAGAGSMCIGLLAFQYPLRVVSQ